METYQVDTRSYLPLMSDHDVMPCSNDFVCKETGSVTDCNLLCWCLFFQKHTFAELEQDSKLIPGWLA